MNRADLQAWLDRYIEAWRANDAAPIEALFSEDAVYRWNPYGGEDHTVRGRTAIVKAWLDEQDDPASWEATYTAYAVDEDRAVATGTSRYLATADEPERTYHNVFLMRFTPDGRCREFTELFMLAR
jgi:ketosteroid isomerase-like protein